MAFAAVDSGNFVDIGDVPPVIVAAPDGTDVQLPAVIIDQTTGDVTVGVKAPDGTEISAVFSQGVNADGSVTMPTVGEQGSAILQQAIAQGINIDDLSLADMYVAPDRSSQIGGWKPLKGMAFVDALWLYAGENNIDPLASAANAMNEGIGGTIGDSGSAYGPWQIHATDGRLARFSGRAANDPEVQAWAWSANGIDYAHQSMAKAGASGLRGHAAVDRILNYFEQPAERVQNLIRRNASYDILAANSGNVKAYLASLVGGPKLPGMTDASVAATISEKTPAGLRNSWSDLMTSLTGHWGGKAYAAIVRSGTFTDQFR